MIDAMAQRYGVPPSALVNVPNEEWLLNCDAFWAGVTAENKEHV